MVGSATGFFEFVVIDQASAVATLLVAGDDYTRHHAVGAFALGSAMKPYCIWRRPVSTAARPSFEPDPKAPVAP